MVLASTISANIDAVRRNPSLIQRAVLDALSGYRSGLYDVVDPTNPFVFCLESAAVLTAAAINETEAATRRQYPAAAQTIEDLYLHMSDKDFVDRFATPSKTKMSFLLPLEELVGKMLDDPDTGGRKIVIPRNSVFSAGGITFSLQYPIEIRQLKHGGLQVVYDGTISSPLQELESNIIPFSFQPRYDGSSWLAFQVDVYQFNIVTQRSAVSLAQPFELAIDITDQFYYARVYVEGTTSSKEIATTHSDQIYDVAVPTAVIKVVDKQVIVKIPQIYTTYGNVTGTVRVDVYQTKGFVNMNLSELGVGSVGAQWLTVDPLEDTTYSAAFTTIKELVVYSNEMVNGGTDALSFEQLRARVIDNSIGPRKLPITNAQARFGLSAQGYDLVADVDNITNRVFLATKNLLAPTSSNLLTPAAASIETVTFSLQSATAISTVIDNGDSITLTPNTLYSLNGGVVNMITSQEIQAVLALPSEKRAQAIMAGNYLFTPFHYVIDTSGSEVEARPYYLDNPFIEHKRFVAENDTSLIQVRIGSSVVQRVSQGYKITIVTASDNTYKQLDDSLAHAQLAYVPYGEKDRAYLMGQQVGVDADGERIYEFILRTNHNLDKNHNLILTEFQMFDPISINTKCPLITDFDVFFVTSAPMGDQWRSGSIEEACGRFQLPASIAGIMHEKMRVRLGYALRTLWARARTTAEGVVYQRWETDIPAIYEEDIFERDANGFAVSVVDGSVVYNYAHRAGDPVLDGEGNPTYRHRAGDIKLDSYGNPIVVNPRSLVHHVDLLLIEGAYWFATAPSALEYRQLMISTLVDWLIDDLSTINDQLLEQTRLYFYPKTTSGTIEVMIGEGVRTFINAAQSFRVTLYVSSVVYNNSALRMQLSKTTVQTINEQLKGNVVSMDHIVSALRDAYGDDVISVQATGLGGAANLPVVTIINDADRCSIRKRLIAQADDTLMVEEDVEVVFVRHEMAL